MRPWAPLALVVALVGLAAAGAQVSGAAGPDLEVVSVSVVGAGPAWVEGKASNSSVEVVVRNRGSVDAVGYQIAYRWIDGAGVETPLNGGAAASVDVSERRLASQDQAGSQQTHSWTWFLQPGQAGSGWLKVVVQPAGNGQDRVVDSNPANNALASKVFVPIHDLQVAVPGASRGVHPDETVFFRVEAHNQGNVEATVALALVPSGGAGLRLHSEVEPSVLRVPPGSRAVATLYVAYPQDNDPQPFSTRVALNATPQYRPGPIQVETPVVFRTDLPYGEDAFAAGLAGPDAAFGSPSQPSMTNWTVRNLGREDDILLVRVDAPPGWTGQATPERLALAAGEWASVTVRATPATTLAPGSAAAAFLNVSSLHAVPPVRAPLLLRVSGPAPELVDGTVASMPVYTGDPVVLRTTAKNLGDAPVPPGTLRARVDLADGASITQDLPMPRIWPGQAHPVSVTFENVAAAGPATFEFAWEIPAAIVPPLSGLFTVRDPQLVLTAPVAGEGATGETVSYTVPPHLFTVRNAGSATESIHLLAIAKSGGAHVLGPQDLTLAPGETRSVAVAHTLPRVANAATASLTLHASIGQRPSLSWEASVATRLLDRHPPQALVAVQPTTWSLGTVLPVAANVSDDGPVPQVVLHVQGPDGANRTLSMHRDEAGAWRAQVRFLAAGEHRLRVAATDGSGNRGEGASWNVLVKEAPVPTLSTELPASGVWDANRPLNVTVHPAEAPALLYVLKQSGNIVRTAEVPFHDGVAAVEFSGAEAGDATLVLSLPAPEGPPVETVLSLRLTRSGPEAPPVPPAGPPTKPTAAAGFLPALAALGVAVAAGRRWP